MSCCGGVTVNNNTTNIKSSYVPAPVEDAVKILLSFEVEKKPNISTEDNQPNINQNGV